MNPIHSLLSDCCDREAMSFLATASGVSGADARDLMLAAVEHRFGNVNRLPITIEWLSNNGSCYLAGETRASLATSASIREPSQSRWNGRSLRPYDQA